MMKRKKSDYFKEVSALLFFLLILSFASCNFGGSQASDDNTAEVEVSGNDGKQSTGKPFFESKEHDFGEINYGEEVGARFGFENRGEMPLVIERVSTGCGCTVAEYTEKPIAPGESGFVEIIFDSRGKSGSQIQNARVYFKELKKPVRLSVVAQVVRK